MANFLTNAQYFKIIIKLNISTYWNLKDENKPHIAFYKVLRQFFRTPCKYYNKSHNHRRVVYCPDSWPRPDWILEWFPAPHSPMPHVLPFILRHNPHIISQLAIQTCTCKPHTDWHWLTLDNGDWKYLLHSEYGGGARSNNNGHLQAHNS